MRKIFMLLAISLFFASAGFSQTKVFVPDTNFKRFLKSNYPLIIDASGDSLLIDSAATVTGSLNCSNKSIANLTGIEYFTNITELYCSYNQLKNLPNLSNLNALEILFCVKNQLTKLPDLSSNPVLKELYCYANQLTTLPDSLISTSIETIDCSNNQITMVSDLSTFKNLSFFRCGLNQLTELPNLSNNKALTLLSCPNNLITKLPDLLSNTSLKSLYCSSNQLTELPDLSSNKNLITLFCTNNELRRLPNLSTLKKLEFLYCSYNQLTELPVLSENIELEKIRCNGNMLFQLPDLSNNCDLEQLSCHRNQLTDLPDLSFNKSLKYLQCDKNKLDFSDAKELQIANQLANLIIFKYSPQKPFGNKDSITVCNTLMLSIESQDSATSYQWFKNSIPLRGQTDTLLIIDKVSISDTGSYTCKSYGTALDSSIMKFGKGVTEFESEVFTVGIEQIVELSGLNAQYCLDDESVALNGIPIGGQYTGAGVYDKTFCPDRAGVGEHSIVYTYTSPKGCVSADTKIVTVLDCNTNIVSGARSKISVAPNPSNSFVYIQGEEFKCYELYNSLGILKDAAKDELIDISGYEPGIYFIKLIDNMNRISVKRILFVE